MIGNTRKLAIIGAFLCSPGIAVSHGDTDAPLFVASEGQDYGDCKDRSMPCQSIAYALKRAGKGGQIRVSDGTYEIETAEDLFHLVSCTIEVFGGFSYSNKFRPSLAHISTLTNVPFEFREQLERRGFHVIADSKGVDRSKGQRTDKLLSLNRKLWGSKPA